MNSGDSLKVRKDSVKVHVQKENGQAVKATSEAQPSIAVKSYTSTYFPTMLARGVEHPRFSVMDNLVQSIIPENIVELSGMGNAPAEGFKFYEHKGVTYVPHIAASSSVSEAPAGNVDSMASPSATAGEASTSHTAAPAPSATVADSLGLVKADSVAKAPAIDSLPQIAFAPQSFKFSDVDSSLLQRFGLQEYISRDSYILLESHPELVYGKFSQKTQVVVPSKVGEAIPRESKNLGFISFALLTVGLIILVISYKFQLKHMLSILKSIVSMREAQKTFQGRSLSFKRYAVLSATFYLLTFTVFAMLVAQKFASGFVKEFGIAPTYLVLFISIVALYFAKLLSLSVIANVSRQKTLFSELKFNHLIFFTTFAIFLFPLQVIASYSDSAASSIFIYISIYLVIILLVQYNIRTLRLFLNYRVSFFFWFLYFCTLELLPLLIGMYLLQ